MKMLYITICTHDYDKQRRLTRVNQLRLGYQVNAEFSIYQNYDSRTSHVGYWHIIHNRTGYSIAMVKSRKDVYKVLNRFNTQLLDYAYVTAQGFLEWRSAESRSTMRQTWQEMKNEGLIVL
jgi:hypothetical protein